MPLIQGLVDKLHAAIDDLPAGLLAGSRTGPLARHLSPKTPATSNSPAIFATPTDEDLESNYAVFNRAWERAFKPLGGDNSQEIRAVISRGKHGLVLALQFLSHYLPLLENGERMMLEPKLRKLLLSINERHVTLFFVFTSKLTHSIQREKT